MSKDLADRLRVLLRDPISAFGAEIEALQVQRAGARRLVRLLVDKDGGVTMDDVAELTGVVSRLLDASPIMGDAPYVLEVSSPGVERPLTLPRHWRRNVGRKVRVRLKDDDRVVLGRVRCIDERAETVTIEMEPSEPRRVLPLTEIKRAVVQVEFEKRDGAEE